MSEKVNNQILLEFVTTKVGVLENSPLYEQNEDLQELIQNFRKDEKIGKLSVTELKLYASDLEHWMDILNMVAPYIPTEDSKTKLVDDFQKGLYEDLQNLNHQAFDLTESDMDVIVDFATGQLEKALNDQNN